jgi:hypothetical protein
LLLLVPCLLLLSTPNAAQPITEIISQGAQTAGVVTNARKTVAYHPSSAHQLDNHMRTNMIGSYLRFV